MSTAVLDIPKPTGVLEQLEGGGVTLRVRHGTLQHKGSLTPQQEALLDTHFLDIEAALLRRCQAAGRFDQLQVGAKWCHACWRYKLAGCFPTQKRLVRYGRRNNRATKDEWITTGDACKDAL